MTQVIERHGTEATICRSICSMLECRNIMTIFTGEHQSRPTAEGCLQKVCYYLFCGVWTWTNFNDDSMMVTVMRHADYTAILINGKFHQTVSEVL
jgi:hypothetical protein